MAASPAGGRWAVAAAVLVASVLAAGDGNGVASSPATGAFTLRLPAPGHVAIAVIRAPAGRYAHGAVPLPQVVAPARVPKGIRIVVDVGRLKARPHTLLAGIVIVNGNPPGTPTHASRVVAAAGDFDVAVGLKWQPLKYTHPIGAGLTPDEVTCDGDGKQAVCSSLTPVSGSTAEDLYGWQITSLEAYISNAAVAASLVPQYDGHNPKHDAELGHDLAQALQTAPASQGVWVLHDGAATPGVFSWFSRLDGSIGAGPVQIEVPLGAPTAWPAAVTFDAQIDAPAGVKVESVVGDLGITKTADGVEGVYPSVSSGLDLEGVVGFAQQELLPTDAVFELWLSPPPAQASPQVSTELWAPLDATDATQICGGFGGGALLGARLDGTAVAPASLQTACSSALPVQTPAPKKWSCNGQIERIFTSFGSGGVAENGGSAPTFSTNGQAYCLTAIQTYHWNKGAGKAPGTLGLTHVSGPAGFASLGPFTAVGSAGQGGAQNVNWQANVPTSPTPSVIDGTYTCVDSDPTTWSTDSAGGTAFCAVWGIPATG